MQWRLALPVAHRGVRAGGQQRRREAMAPASVGGRVVERAVAAIVPGGRVGAPAQKQQRVFLFAERRGEHQRRALPAVRLVRIRAGGQAPTHGASRSALEELDGVPVPAVGYGRRRGASGENSTPRQGGRGAREGQERLGPQTPACRDENSEDSIDRHAIKIASQLPAMSNGVCDKLLVGALPDTPLARFPRLTYTRARPPTIGPTSGVWAHGTTTRAPAPAHRRRSR